MPLTAVLFFIFCLANCGTPLTVNFIGEFLSLYGAFERMPVLGALAASSIVFSAAYSIYLFNRVAFGGTFSLYFEDNFVDLSKREFAILGVLVLFIVLLGIYPNFILDGLHFSVSGLIYACSEVLYLNGLNNGVDSLSSSSLSSLLQSSGKEGLSELTSNFRKFYSTKSSSSTIAKRENPSSLPVSLSGRLSPEFCEWFTGFVDAEGLFAVYLRDNKRPTISFRISLHKDDEAVLKFIQDQLGAGIISVDRDSLVFYLQKAEDLENILFPLLDSFPLNSTKYMDYLILKKTYYIKKNRLYLTDEGILELNSLLSQLNNKRTDFSYPDNHVIRITLNWLLGFIEGDGGFYSNVSKKGHQVKLEFNINQTEAEEKLIDGIVLYLTNLANIKVDGNGKTSESQQVKVRKMYTPAKKSSEQPSYRVVINDTVYLHNVLLPIFNLLTFRTKKALDYQDWSIIVKICFLGLHLTDEGLSLMSDLHNRMNNHRLSTHKSYNVIEITKDRIDQVLSLKPIYAYNEEEGYRYNLLTGNKVSVRRGVVLIDPQRAEELIFSSTIESAKYLNEDRKRVTRYINKDKILKCHNGKNYYVKEL